MDIADPAGDRQLVTGRLVDHHCHGLVLRDLTRVDFEAMLTESTRPSPLGTTPFDSMVGLAVRRWCAPVLGLDPLVDADTYLARRRELGHREVATRLLAASATETFLVDTGFSADLACDPATLAELAGGRADTINRLEWLAEQLLAEGGPFADDPAGRLSDFPERFTQLLADASGVGAKSIAAYRVGLELAGTKPSDDELVRALGGQRPRPGGTYRIAHPVVHSWLAWTAIEQGLPLQFHVGYGDNDLDLHRCDPLLLTGFLRATEDYGVPVLLLHNYPFHRHAAYLAQVFDHAFMDVGLATHNTGALSPQPLAESLELVPFGKLLYSSDAFGLPELYLLASTLFRRGLARILERLADEQEMTTSDAQRVAALVLRDNARRIYRLPAA